MITPTPPHNKSVTPTPPLLKPPSNKRVTLHNPPNKMAPPPPTQDEKEKNLILPSQHIFSHFSLRTFKLPSSYQGPSWGRGERGVRGEWRKK